MTTSGGKPKAVVALAGARDGFQLPLALSEGGLLERLVTDLYWPADRRWFASSIGALFPKNWIDARFRPGLESRKVNVSARSLSAFTLMKAFPALRLNRYKDKGLGSEAGRIALREEAALFCYSTYAHAAFKEVGKEIPHRFLFQLHPHPQSVRKILLDEVERMPQAKASLMNEYELALEGRELEDLCEEASLAVGWTVTSSFSAQTLTENGIPRNRIQIVPYGVDHRVFTQRAVPPVAKYPLTIIYVGSLVQRKGLMYLLEAVRLLKTKQIRLWLCGRGQIDQSLLAYYSDQNIEIKWALTRQELVRRIHEADVFVLPSLAEGFAHVILETMSCGLPVIATPHTCAPDVIEPGKHGFIVPIRDAAAIAERMAWGLDNRAELVAMGEAAAVRARQFTWERFRAGVRDAYRQMLVALIGEAVLRNDY